MFGMRAGDQGGAAVGSCSCKSSAKGLTKYLALAMKPVEVSTTDDRHGVGGLRRCGSRAWCLHKGATQPGVKITAHAMMPVGVSTAAELAWQLEPIGLQGSAAAGSIYGVLAPGGQPAKQRVNQGSRPLQSVNSCGAEPERNGHQQLVQWLVCCCCCACACRALGRVA